MALKIRLWQQGCTNRTTYRVVVADSRSPRDGKYVEAIGWYNPCGKTDDLRWLTVAAVAKKATPTAMRDYAQQLDARRSRRAAKRNAA